MLCKTTSRRPGFWLVIAMAITAASMSGNHGRPHAAVRSHPAAPAPAPTDIVFMTLA